MSILFEPAIEAGHFLPCMDQETGVIRFRDEAAFAVSRVKDLERFLIGEHEKRPVSSGREAGLTEPSLTAFHAPS